MAMMWRRSVLIVTMVLGWFTVFSQVSVRSEGVLSINPSNEGMALIKSIERPASLATGIPDVSIPLFSAKSAGLSYSLKYLGGGLLADELPTSCGLGWYMQGGAAIYRVVEGLPDELPSKGYLAQSSLNSSLFSLNVGQFTSSSATPLLDMANANDGMPDIFYYDIFGIKGKFMLLPGGNTICFPNNNLKITYTIAGTNDLFAFKVAFSDGRTAVLDVREAASVTSFPGMSDFTYYSGWLISKLLTYNSISLTYSYSYSDDVVPDYQQYSNGRLGFDRVYKDGGGATSSLQKNYQISFKHPLLAHIRGIGFSVDFSYGKLPVSFATIPVTQFWNRLTKVNLKYSNLTLAKLALHRNLISSTSVLEANFATKLTYQNTTATDRTCMMLQQVSVSAPGVSLPTTMDYYGAAQSPTNTKDVDIWGFANGKPNTTFIPTIYATGGNYTCYPIGGTVAYAGANRSAVLEGSLGGTLKSITTPSGAKTSYEYELPELSYRGVSLRGNGLRVTRIVSSEGNDPGKQESTLFDYTGGAMPVSYDPLRWVKPATNSTAQQGDGFSANVMLMEYNQGVGIGGVSPAATYKKVSLKKGSGSTTYYYELPVDRGNTASLPSSLSFLFSLQGEQLLTSLAKSGTSSVRVINESDDATDSPLVVWNEPYLVKSEVKNESGVVVASSTYTYGPISQSIVSRGFVCYPSFIENYTSATTSDPITPIGSGSLDPDGPTTPPGGIPLPSVLHDYSGTVGEVFFLSGWRTLDKVESKLFSPSGDLIKATTQVNTFVGPNRNFLFLKQSSITALGQETVTNVNKYCFETDYFSSASLPQVSALSSNLQDCLNSAGGSSTNGILQDYPNQLSPATVPNDLQARCYSDYDAASGSLFTDRAKAITILKSREMYDQPLEELTLVSRSGSVWVTKANFALMKEDTTESIQPYKLYQFEGFAPFSSFTSLQFTSTSPVDVTFDSRYKLVKEVTRYGTHGEVQEYRGQDGVLVSTQYDTDGRFPILTGYNIAYDQLSQYTALDYTNVLQSLRNSYPNARLTAQTSLEPYGVIRAEDANGQVTYNTYNSLGDLVAQKDNDKNLRSVSLRHLPLQVGEPSIVTFTDPDANSYLLRQDAFQNGLHSRFRYIVSDLAWDTPCRFDILGFPAGNYDLYLDYGDGSTEKVTGSVKMHKYRQPGSYLATLKAYYRGNLVGSDTSTVRLVSNPFSVAALYMGDIYSLPTKKIESFKRTDAPPSVAMDLTISLTMNGGSGEYALAWSDSPSGISCSQSYPSAYPQSAISGEDVSVSFSDGSCSHTLSCTVTDKVTGAVLKTYTWTFAILNAPIDSQPQL